MLLACSAAIPQTINYTLLRTSLTKVAVLPSTSPTSGNLSHSDRAVSKTAPPPEQTNPQPQILNTTSNALNTNCLDLCNDTKSHTISCEILPYNQWPKNWADQSHSVYVPLIFFFFLSALSLIPLQLLDNANRSQANGTEQDNGAFIAAWLTWL